MDVQERMSEKLKEAEKESERLKSEKEKLLKGERRSEGGFVGLPYLPLSYLYTVVMYDDDCYVSSTHMLPSYHCLRVFSG